MRYNDDYENRRVSGADESEDDAIFEFLEQRSRRREYEEFLEHYSAREDDDYIGSRESNSARRVLSEGRVTGRGQSRSAQSVSSRRSSQQQSRNQHSRSEYSGAAKQSGRYTESNNSERYDRDDKVLTLGQIIKRLIVAAVLLTAAFIIGYYTLMDSLTKDINIVEIDTSGTVYAADSVAHIDVRGNTSTVKNILLLGIDDDGESGSRSDTIMIASVDTRNGTIKLCSILRDNYVRIPGYQDNRINAAYAFGGTQLTLKTIEANFRLKIDDYVSVDMEALQHIVDAVGGVTITITKAEADQINWYSYSENTASEGEQLLDGKQAVCYARIRKIDSDFGRTNRQRVLISSIVAKCKTLSIGDLTGLIETVSPYLTTNMSSRDIATLGLRVLPALGNEFGQMSIPAEGMYSSQRINGAAVLVSDLEANTKLLHEFLYGE